MYISTTRQGRRTKREVKANIKKMQPPKYKLTKEEHKAMEELKRDKTRMILTTDKGVSFVVIDKEEYIKKADDLLSQSSYKNISHRSNQQVQEQVDNSVKEDQNRRWNGWCYLQKALPYWG